MRLLVCGGRDYRDWETVCRVLDYVHTRRPVALLIHGGADGADSLAGDWARTRGIPAQVFKAEWDVYGRRAGRLRNQRMIDEGRPDGMVAFPGGFGTADMVRRARAAGLPVWRPVRTS